MEHIIVDLNKFQDREKMIKYEHEIYGFKFQDK